MTKRLCVSTASLALALTSAMLAPAVAADLSIAPIYKAPPTAAGHDLEWLLPRRVRRGRVGQCRSYATT